MPRRKHIYITLASVIVLGSLIAIAARFYWTSTQDVSSVGNSRPDINEKTDVPKPRSGSDSHGPEALPADTENSRSAGYPDIMNLLKTSRSEQKFGSYWIKGIIVNTTSPESSSATIEDLSDNTSSIYSLNDTLPDNSRLVDIKQDYVVLEKSGVRKRLYIQQTRISRGGKRSFGSGKDPTGYEKINDNEYNLNPYRVFRGDADRVLDFTMKVASRDGRMDGIRISNIGDNSLAGKLGLQENDVLLSVNRESVDSILSGIYACINAYNSDDLELEVLRGDKVIPLTYHLFWEGQGSWTPGDVLRSKAVSSLLRNGFISNLF